MSEPELIRLTCPACAKKITVKAELAGRQIRCPNKACGQVVAVPDLDEESEPSRRVLWPWLVGGAVLLVLVVGFGVWALTRGGKPVPPANDPPVPVIPPDKSPPVTPTSDPKEPPDLPGSAGERLTYSNKPADLRAVYLSDSENLPKGGPEAPWEPAFASGTKKLRVGVVFARERQDVRIAVRLQSAAGKTTITEDLPNWLMLGASTYIRFLDLKPEAGAWPDGNYQAEVLVDDVKVAVLNWSITKDAPKSKEPEVTAKAEPPKVPEKTPEPVKVADLPVDKSLTFDMVRNNVDKHQGKCVLWPVSPLRSNDNVLICADTPSFKNGNPLLAKVFAVQVSSSDACRDILLEALRFDYIMVTGTVAWSEMMEFDMTITGVAEKFHRKEMVPVLVDPTFKVGERVIYSHFGGPTKLEPGPRKSRPKVLAGVDAPLATVVAGQEPLTIPTKLFTPFIALSPDGKTLAVLESGREKAGRTGILIVLDARTGAERGRYPLPRFGMAVAFAADGKTVAIGTEHPDQNAVNKAGDCPVYLVDVTSGTVTATLKGNRATWFMGIESVVFSADGKTLASAAQGDAVRVWDVATGTERKALKLESFQFGRGLSPDGRWALIGTADIIRLIDTATGEKGMEANHPDWREGAFAPTGQVLVTSAYKEPGLRAWNTETGKELARAQLRDPAWSPVFSPDGKWLYFTTGPKEGRKADLWVWNVTNAAPVHLRTLENETVASIRIAADGSALAVSTFLVTGARVRTWSTAAPAPPSTPAPAPQEDELVLLSAGPADKSLVPVLRFVGNDLGKALAAGNRLTDTTKTDALVRVDPKDLKSGTVEWRGFEWRRGEAKGVTNLGQPGITLKVRRKTPTTTDWELTDEAMLAIRMRLAKQ